MNHCLTPSWTGRSIPMILVLFAQLWISNAVGQKGPGGVGATTGASDLSLWLDAGTISGLSNNDNMTGVWDDLSGNGYNAVIGTAPQYKSAGGGNGQPSLFFDDNNNEYMYVPTNSEIMPAGELSVFVVANFENGSDHWASIISAYDDDAGNDGWAFERNGGSDNMNFWIDDYTSENCLQTMTYGQDEVWSMVFNTTDNTGYAYLSENGCTFNFNGPMDYHGGANDDLLIGAGADGGGPGYFMRCDICEVIIYEVAVNDAQRIIISNYLSAKYDTDLDNYDIYDEDDNGDYDFDVSGIGRIDAANIHDDSQGASMVRILNPTGLNDDEFMFWGHDNASTNAMNTADVPAGVDARIERIWRVSERNSANSSNVNVGNVDMRWDLSFYPTPITTGDLVLLIDTDNDGSFTDETGIGGAIDLGGGIYEFSSVSGGSTGLRNNRRFTIGPTNAFRTPLPIDMLSFKVNERGEHAQLSWETAQEINNDFFTIERSVDTHFWEEVGQVKGSGNSTVIQSYSFLDLNPGSGLFYYRIKQTDFNGDFSYSQIKTITIISSLEFTCYPNPSKGSVNIRFNDPIEARLQIYSSDGRLHYDKIDLQNKFETIHLERAGVYSVVCSSVHGRLIKRIVITE